MKLTLKKALSLLVAAAMLLSLAACADKTAGTAAPAASTDTSASAGINRDAVAVRVGDRDITAGEIADMYTQYVSMYQAYGMAAPTASARWRRLSIASVPSGLSWITSQSGANMEPGLPG